MAPSTSVKAGRKPIAGRINGQSASREATPTGPASNPTGKNDTELAAAFKLDLTNIRDLVTCSICDQLLYEPWTLGCGHTYCYSCLCSWFVPNQRKKTCPECRTRVKQIPAPNFLVKQMVDIFTKRIELMPADESIDQHTQKLAEEAAAVDKDKNSVEGIFKGLFPTRSHELWYDEGDGVLRCPSCGHEHEGGPNCQVCGAEVDDPGFADFSDDDIEDLDDVEIDVGGFGLDDEVDAEVAANEDPFFLGGYGIHRHHFALHHHPALHHHHFGPVDFNTDHSDFDGSGGDSEDDDDEAGSLQDFVAPDDDEEPIRRPIRNRQRPRAQPITISDSDDSDEGGAVSNHRGNRRTVVGSSSPATHSVVTVTDASANGSEAGDMNEAEMLRHAGWSPLDQGNDSDVENPAPYSPYGGGYGANYGLTEDDHDSDDSDTNTETMVGNGGTDDDDVDDDRSRENSSDNPEINGYDLTNEDTDDDDSGHMDGDGDTEMSVSPRAYRRSLSETPAANAYSIDHRYYETTDDDEYHDVDGSRGGVEPPNAYGGTQQDLGVANEVHNAEDDASDTSIQPPVRRVPRRYHQDARGQQYDPRISMIFAEHQQSLRGSQNNPIGLELDGLDVEVRRIVESASRNRRTAYRALPPRRADPLRSSRSPSANRVIASSDRSTRNPRQYNQRRRN